MNEQKDFATWAAELEGDANVHAGVRHPTYAQRHVPGRAAREGAGARSFERELDDALAQVRTKVHEAMASSAVETIQLEVSVLEDVWRVRLIERRGGQEVLRVSVSEAPLAEERR